MLSRLCSRHGIPSQLRTDNGPQFASAEMECFSKAYGLEHTTSSPRYPQSNGQVERTVRTVKNRLKVGDMYLALLVYHSTPLQRCNRSPTELRMGRRLRTNLPQVPSVLIPDWTYVDEYGEADKLYKERLKRNFDQRLCVASLPVNTDSGVVRPNRHDLITVPPKSTPAVPSSDSTNLPDCAVTPRSPVMTRCRSKMLTQRKEDVEELLVQ